SLSTCAILAGASTDGRRAAGASPQDSGGKWYRLFDGKTLAGWTPKICFEVLGSDESKTFRAADGMIQVRYDDYGEFRGRIGHLFFNPGFSTYRLRMDYRFVGDKCKGGPDWGYRNGGFTIHGEEPELMERDQQFPVALEVQLMGGDGRKSQSTANLHTSDTNVSHDGRLNTEQTLNSKSATFHGDQWVTVELEVHGAGRILHRIGNETVLEYEQPQYDPDKPSARKLVRGDGILLIEGGTIALQSKSCPMDFRNIELMPLG
ncbi:MAG: 3-keto-disaccharide hydrolase, partial [Planctomycetia bacterium]